MLNKKEIKELAKERVFKVLIAKNGKEVDLCFNPKDESYEGQDKWCQTDHYSVVEYEEYNGELFIDKTLFRSENKNECIVYLKSILKDNHLFKRSLLYKRFEDM
jgi:hypothetical protein